MERHIKKIFAFEDLVSAGKTMTRYLKGAQAERDAYFGELYKRGYLVPSEFNEHSSKMTEGDGHVVGTVVKSMSHALINLRRLAAARVVLAAVELAARSVVQDKWNAAF